MASLERLAWRGAGRDFAIIGISTDDYMEQAQAALKQGNATISHFIDRQMEMEQILGAARLPLTVLVDAHGRVLEKVFGAREWDSPEQIQLIDRLFHHTPSGAAPTRPVPSTHRSRIPCASTN